MSWQDDPTDLIADLRRQLAEVKQSYDDMYDQCQAIMSLRDNLVKQLGEKSAEIERLRNHCAELLEADKMLSALVADKDKIIEGDIAEIERLNRELQKT